MHEGHQGSTKTKEFLRTRVGFPRLDKMVEVHIQHCHPCQVVNMSQEGEPLRMTPMPSEPWKEVAEDFWGPINTREYLLVTVCKQSRWAEEEFVTSTSARAVILKMDKTFASLGIPLVARIPFHLHFRLKIPLEQFIKVMFTRRYSNGKHGVELATGTHQICRSNFSGAMRCSSVGTKKSEYRSLVRGNTGL